MAGILESLFDNGGWQQVLGIGSANAAPAGPPPMPPQQAMQGAPPSFSPTSAFDAGTIAPPGGPSFADRAAPVQAAIADGTMDPQGMNGTNFAPPSPMPPQMQGAGPQPVAYQPGPPMPPPGAGGQPGGGGSGPMPPMSPQAPPMPPPMPPTAGPPTMNAGGGLAASLGLSPQQAQSTLAGIGRGMSAVGGMRSGAPRGATFATGLGGGIQGQQAKETEQVAQERQAKNDLFTQSSTAFKDVLAARAAGENTKYKDAQGEYLKARAQSLMTGGAKGVPKTPYDKVTWVEGQSLKFRDQIRKTAEINARQNGTPVDEKAIDERVAKYKNDLYKSPQINMDPKEADKIKNWGTSKETPFDTKGMTLDQFNEQVPLNAWYKDQNGELRQRVKPPAGMAPAAADQTAVDDQAALAG